MASQKRSPKEILEGGSKDYEQTYFKAPGKELVDISKISTEGGVSVDNKKARKEWKKLGKPYTNVHTHPFAELDKAYEFSEADKKSAERLESVAVMPSGHDMDCFLTDDQIKTMVIAQKSVYTGDVEGYLVVRKTAKTPRSNASEISKGLLTRIKDFFIPSMDPPEKLELSTKSWKYELDATEAVRAGPDEVYNLFSNFANRYHLKYKFISAKEYKLDHHKTRFVRKNLEQKVLGLVGILFFLVSFLANIQISGYTILSFNQSSLKFGGIVSFLLGIFLTYLYFRTYKNQTAVFK